MPLRTNYCLKAVCQELEKSGVYLLEEFPDGQLRFGNQPPPAKGVKFRGRSAMIAPYSFQDGAIRFDIFSIRNIFERLGKADELAAFEKRLEPRLNET